MIHAWRLVLLSAILFVISPLGCQGLLKISINETEIDFGLFKTLEISLPSQLSYKISCMLMDSDTFSVNPWTHDSMDVPEETDPSSLQSQTIAFYENEHIDKNTLYINNFDSTLSGNYTCHSAKNTTSLIITEGNPAVFLLNKYEERTGGTGGSFVVNYFFLSNPSLTDFNYTWLYEGVPLVDETIYIEKFFKSFVVDVTGAYKKEHAGVYTLVVVTSLGTANDSFTLQVFTRPTIEFDSDCGCLANDEENNFFVAVDINDSFNISCEDTNSNPLPTFTWFRYDTEASENSLKPDNHVNIAMPSTRESTLVFSNIQLEYAGDYSCKANNSQQKDFRTVTVHIRNSPQIQNISPFIINTPVNDDVSILIQYDGGYPGPIADWSYINDPIDIPVSENDRSYRDGFYNLNLTIFDATVSDGGVYILTVSNGVGDNVTLEFTVNILVPPSLIRNSSQTSYRPVGGVVEFVVDVSVAQPPVTIDDLIWSGNFAEDRQNVTYENNNAILMLRDLSVSDTGNVTLTIEHSAGNVSQKFELIVLNVPNTPNSINITSIGTCHKRLSWVIDDPAPQTAPIDRIQLQHRACLYNDTSCDKNWELLTEHPPDVQSCDIALSPNQAFSYSVISCSDYFGCSNNNVLPIAVVTTVQGFTPKVTSLLIKTISESSIQVTWGQPQQHTDCYTINNYNITCQNTHQIDQTYTTKVTPDQNSSDYSIILTDLEPDNRYNCSVTILYKDLFNDTVDINSPPCFAVHQTYPHLPSIGQTLDLAVIDNIRPGTASIDLTTLWNTFTKEDSSFILIIVLRLGNSPTLHEPTESINKQYPNIEDFSTYEEVHLENGRLSYEPYIAAEINLSDIPEIFDVGSDSIQKRDTFTNGPLDIDDYYTVFIRVYAKSQFGIQVNVFVSSNFSTPFQSKGESSATDMVQSNSGMIAGIIIVVLIVLVLIAIGVAVIVFITYRRRGKKHTTTLSTQIGDTVNGDIGMNQYSHLGEVKGRTESPPPDLPSTGPPKTRPITATNPTFDNESSKVTPEKEDRDTKSVSLKMAGGDNSLSNCSRVNTPSPTSPVSMNGNKSPNEPISRDAFQSHLDYLDDNEQLLFAKEFKSIQSYSRERPAEASSRAHMHGKNRYTNITAFDYTRVTLTEIDNKPNSDYINANYIKGYDEHKLYIATQGPTEETHVDFWRMIWEQRTTTIIMLTNLEEKGKAKCYKYWPSSAGIAYGNIVVRVDRDIVLPYYTIRSFKLIDAGVSDGERTVIQFHYTAWPDKNVPAQAFPVLDFLRAINSANDSAKHGPVVAHCSAGVGRTGTIIALDICLDQLKTEGRVDVRSVVSFLREQRTQMVQTQSQYIFIHHAILEDIVYGDSTVLLKNYPEKYLKLQASHCALIKQEYEKIGMVKPPAQANPGPNMVKIQSEDDDEAVLPAFVIDGYWYQNLFITCSSPLPNNEELFWRLIWQEGCSHVINVSQKTHGLSSYLPDSGQQIKMGELDITVENMEYKTGYILRTITIATEQCKETVSVKHMQYEDWLSNQLPRTDKFVKFLQECMREINSIERQGKPVLVHDNGSMSQVGIFITLLNCCERIKKERLVDLLQSVNRLNLQCPRLISSMELNFYAYCYDSLHEFCGKLLRENSEPPIYENIASIRGRLQPSPEPVQEMPRYLKDYEILDDSILYEVNR